MTETKPKPMTTITPTVGRILLFYSGSGLHSTPLPAILISPHDETALGVRYVSVFVIGLSRQFVTSVPLYDAGTGPDNEARCEWMQFQQQQAKDAAELAAIIAAGDDHMDNADDTN